MNGSSLVAGRRQSVLAHAGVKHCMYGQGNGTHPEDGRECRHLGYAAGPPGRAGGGEYERVTGSNGEPAQDEQIAQLVQEIDQAGRSGDAETLQGLLGRARDRLSFYEGFDRVIADNVRRSGELMLESLTLRDQIASEHDQVGKRERSALLEQVSALQEQFAGISTQVEQASQALAALRQSLDRDGAGEARVVTRAVPSGDEAEATDTAEEPAAAVSSGDDTAEATAPAEPEADGPDVEESASGVGAEVEGEHAAAEDDASDEAASEEDASDPPTTGWDEPRVIDVIAHDVAKAATALSLQNHLRGLEQVNKVDAREFASGVLRLQVTATTALSEADLQGWDGAEHLAIAVLQDQVVELRLKGA